MLQSQTEMGFYLLCNVIFHFVLKQYISYGIIKRVDYILIERNKNYIKIVLTFIEAHQSYYAYNFFQCSEYIVKVVMHFLILM